MYCERALEPNKNKIFGSLSLKAFEERFIEEPLLSNKELSYINITHKKSALTSERVIPYYQSNITGPKNSHKRLRRDLSLSITRTEHRSFIRIRRPPISERDGTLSDITNHINTTRRSTRHSWRLKACSLTLETLTYLHFVYSHQYVRIAIPRICWTLTISGPLTTV